MKALIQLSNHSHLIDLNAPIPISIPLKEGAENPNCYYASPPSLETIRFGDTFVGDVNEGGSCNYQKITITPHGNGTHTECVGHITAQKYCINTCLQKFWFVAELLTITPQMQVNGDLILKKEDVAKHLEAAHRESQNIEALLIRTTPNTETKKSRHYSGTNPPYLEENIGAYLCQKKINHLLVDLPSVDREEDGGKLSVHRGFWNIGEDRKMTPSVRTHATITELIYIPNSVQDGLYMLNIQIPDISIDAAPSMPVLYIIENTSLI